MLEQYGIDVLISIMALRVAIVISTELMIGLAVLETTGHRRTKAVLSPWRSEVLRRSALVWHWGLICVMRLLVWVGGVLLWWLLVASVCWWLWLVGRVLIILTSWRRGRGVSSRRWRGIMLVVRVRHGVDVIGDVVV